MVAITLLLLHVAQLAGYHLFFEYCIARSDKQLQQQLDNGHYLDADLLEIKIPLQLPYTSNWSDYERVDGEIIVNGIYYTYVKRKVSNNTLYLLCLPNNDKTHYNQVKHQLAGRANAHSTSDQAPPTVKKGAAMPELQQPVNTFQLNARAKPVTPVTGYCAHRINEPALPRAGKPPRPYTEQSISSVA